ncbi:MAG: tetratricopeptide repeat protein [Bacteroidota bacterium]
MIESEMVLKHLLGALLLTFLGLPGLLAQPGRTTEEVVNTQKIFIDANREKLLGNYEDAAYLYKEVLKRDKENHAAAYELARVYDVLDSNDKALSSIKMAIRLDSENVWYQMFLGDVYEKSKQFKDAVKVYEELVEKHPSVDYYYSKLAFYLINAKAPKKAIAVYDRMEKLIGISEDITRKKHSLYISLGDNKRAANEMVKLIAVYPSQLRFRHTLANFYKKTGEQEKAAEVYRQILAINPEDARATIALNAGTNGGSADEEAQAYLSSLQPIFKKEEVDIDLKIKELIPFISQVANSNDKQLAENVIELVNLLEEVHPEEAKVYSAHGDLLYHSGRPQAALDKYLKALEYDKKVYPIWEQVMYIYAENNDMSKLLDISSQALDRFPNKAKAYYFNGIALSEADKDSEAVGIFQQALMMSRKNPPLQVDLFKRLGVSYFQLKKYPRSDKAFESALKIRPKDAMTLNEYSARLAARGEQLEKAKSMAALANELMPNKAYLQDTYGWVLYKMKDYSGAKEWLAKALANGGQDLPQVLEHYGDVLFQLNDVENALLHWQQAQEKGSTSDLLEKKIADRQLYE